MTWNPKDDIYKKFALTPDQQLLLWEDWIQIREHEIVKLAYRTMRPPADLAMNLLEKRRPDVERKIILEDVQVAIKPRIRDGYWENKLRLTQYCPCANVYEVQKTAAEMGKPRIMEHVLCPNYIQQHEKGLLGEPERSVCSKLNKSFYEYRLHREEVYKERIAKIDPYRPDIKELIVIGRTPEPPPKKVLLPEILITPPTNVCQEDALSGVYALRINNTITIKHMPDQDLTVLKNLQRESWHENCFSWTYYFNVSENRIGRSKLFLENLGTVSLRYCWKKVKKVIPFIPEESYEQKFFFNKNEDVISPGSNKTICFSFVSSKAGIFCESWDLVLMNVSLFDNVGDKFSVHLMGDTVENLKKMARKVEKLEIRIDKKAKIKFVFDLINDIIVKATSVEHETYPYKKWFIEAEHFVARNMQHYYHQTEVQTLKDMYKEMTNDEWDLSLLTWRNAMIEKEFDDRMNYYDQFKRSHIILLTPWYEGDDVLTEKLRAVKLLLGQLAVKFFDEFERVSEWNGAGGGPKGRREKEMRDVIVSPIKVGPLTDDIIHNIFYIRMLGHVANTIEIIAGVISSLDLNRWIEFDFCQF